MYDSVEEFVSRQNYITKEPYISGRIVEYDIKAANISTLYKYKAIDKNYYDYLSKMPKLDREIIIGRMIGSGDNDYAKIIRDGIKQTLYKFITVNNIDINSIIRKANDALYINCPVDVKVENIDGILVRKRKVYSSFLQLNKVLLLFYYDQNNNLNVDIKGIRREQVQLHNGYILSVIGTTIFMAEISSPTDALEYLNNIIEEYIEGKLEFGYYREFNTLSGYRYNNIGNASYITTNIDSLDNIDISYNLNILRELYSVIFNMYIKLK